MFTTTVTHCDFSGMSPAFNKFNSVLIVLAEYKDPVYDPDVTWLPVCSSIYIDMEGCSFDNVGTTKECASVFGFKNSPLQLVEQYLGQDTGQCCWFAFPALSICNVYYLSMCPLVYGC